MAGAVKAFFLDNVLFSHLCILLFSGLQSLLFYYCSKSTSFISEVHISECFSFPLAPLSQVAQGRQRKNIL